MLSSSEYYIKALEEVKANAQRAEQKAENKKQRMYNSLPEVKQIDMKIASTVTSVIKRKLINHEAVDYDEVSKGVEEMQKRRADLIKSIGMNEEDFKPRFNCKLCNDGGYHNGKMCECVKKLAAKMMYDDINRDVSLENSTFNHFNLEYYSDKPNEYGEVPREIMTKIYDVCMKYADSFSKKSASLLFYGDTGLGKTFLAACIARTVADKGYSVVYESATHLFNKLEKARFSEDEQALRDANKYCECDLLIIDDLGTEVPGQFVTSSLYTLINDRLQYGKSTIISTNLRTDELDYRYSPQIASRLRGNYKRIAFLGDDIRTMKAW